MKRIFVPTVFTAAALLVAPAVLAETPRNASTYGTQGISTLSEAELDRQVTVSDLLGKSVIGENNQPIGLLRDIDLTGIFVGGSTHTTTPAGGGGVSLLIASESESSLLSLNADEVTYDQSRGDLRLAVAVSTEGNVSRSGRSAAADKDQPRVENDELAPVEVAVNDPANTIEPVAVAAVPGSDIEVATTGAEVLQIEEALARNPATSEVADQINVLSSNDAILLTGALASREQRDQVMEVAREASDREVRDLLQVAAE